MARVYRFFLRHTSADQFHKGNFILEKNNEPEIFEQLTKVLRIKSGQNIVLLPLHQTGNVFEYQFTVQTIAAKAVILEYVKEFPNNHELKSLVGLILCLPNKPDKLEFILQKAVEIGVQEITLVEGDFSQMKHQLRIERLEKIILEAAEQSERGMVPILHVQKKLKDYIHHSDKTIFVAMERSEHSFLALLKQKSNAINILVGPEGGFSDEEKKLIQEKNFSTFSLGKRILRMETAALVSLGIAALAQEE